MICAAPSPPTITRAVNTSSTSILVEWNPPSNPNGNIRGYLINYTLAANIGNPFALMSLNVSGKVTHIELSGLNIFTTYSISIQAWTIKFGDPSNTVNVTTSEDGKFGSSVTS